MIQTMLEQEFKYFLDHKDELANKYGGKYIVIVGNEVVGVFDEQLDAYKETKKSRQLGTFLIQKCEQDPSAYTQTFHTRAIFNIPVPTSK